ncbi:MAG TPA: hypothetical protein PK777_01525 [Thermoguttaceae bacterium]|nr:hypothetical protein [Thermoguttaceae bacterium]HPP51601.1 hypothetical protein [Thermoguttaceae bacterium]
MNRLIAMSVGRQIGCRLAAMLLGTLMVPTTAVAPVCQLWAAQPTAGPPVKSAEQVKTEEAVSPSAAKAAETPSALQKRLQRELGEAGLSEEENPFLSILQQMREAEMLLGRGETGTRTQQIQKQILAELDQLVAQAQQSGQAQVKLSPKGKPESASPGFPQGASPSEPKETAPGASKQPTAKTPSGGSGEEKTAEVQQIRSLLQEVWGLLPPGQRQQMIEAPVEEFLPKYKPLIIEYFRRLAELRSHSKGN